MAVESIDRVSASSRSLGPLRFKVLEEKGTMSLVLVKVVRSEDGRDDRNAGVELDPHSLANHRIGDELMTVDAAINDETRRHDCVVGSAPAGRRRELDLEGASLLRSRFVIRDLELPNLRAERRPALADEIIARRLDEALLRPWRQLGRVSIVHLRRLLPADCWRKCRRGRSPDENDALALSPPQAEGSTNCTCAGSKSRWLSVATVRSWARAVAAIRLSLIDIGLPRPRRSASSCAQRIPTTESHGTHWIRLTPCSNQCSSLVRRAPRAGAGCRSGSHRG